eukprot:scaffold360_cov128-Isochrysis_galbana.AAC.1
MSCVILGVGHNSRPRVAVRFWSIALTRRGQRRPGCVVCVWRREGEGVAATLLSFIRRDWQAALGVRSVNMSPVKMYPTLTTPCRV